MTLNPNSKGARGQMFMKCKKSSPINGHVELQWGRTTTPHEPRLVSSGVQLLGKGKECNKMGKKGTTIDFFNLKQPRGANKYPQYTAVYSKYTAVYSRVYGRILRYWSLEYTAVYPKSPKWGIFKHNIDHHNWQTRGIPQPTYACIVHYTFVPTCTCHIPLSPKTPFFTRILPGIWDAAF